MAASPVVSSAFLAIFLAVNLLGFAVSNATPLPPPSPYSCPPLTACGSVLGNLLTFGVNYQWVENDCCPVLQGLAGAEAAACVCAAITTNFFGFAVADATVAVDLLLGYCSIPVPVPYTCS